MTTQPLWETPSERSTVIDPDCRDGKHRSCLGGPCLCECHDDDEAAEAASEAEKPTMRISFAAKYYWLCEECETVSEWQTYGDSVNDGYRHMKYAHADHRAVGANVEWPEWAS